MDKSKIIYVALPYSHPERAMRTRRFLAANRYAAKLMLAGHVVFSPISHSHPISIHLDNSCDSEFYLKQDLPFMRACDEMHILCLYGWEESSGIKAEVELAKELGMKVKHINEA